MTPTTAASNTATASSTSMLLKVMMMVGRTQAVIVHVDVTRCITVVDLVTARTAQPATKHRVGGGFTARLQRLLESSAEFSVEVGVDEWIQR